MMGTMDSVDSSIPLRPGSRLDRYELVCPIASGGMAVVWLARLRGKRGFEKLFAVKTIKTELLDDARFQEMFLDEARIASGIQHPNVAQILDLGEQDDVLYIVMEWVDGESLAKIRRLAPKRSAPLPLGVTLRVMADACAGLHAAHELRDVRGESVGVVHRDVSPQNILVTPAGSVKVIDFGIAKATNRSAGDTRSGVVKGKIHYMAPEQAGGLPVDRRADIWAVGVCLYELVTGKLPFDGDSDVDVVRRLLGTEPAPRVSASVPDAVAEILAHSLVRDPNERFSTAGAMQRALETAIDRLALAARHHDVAEYLNAHFADLTKKRREIVSDALASAETRASDADEVAFAPTVMSERPTLRRAAEDVDTKALTKRERAISPPYVPTHASRVSSREDSSVTPRLSAFEMDEEAAGLPKRRGWVWALLLMCVAGGLYGWKMGGVAYVRALVSPPSVVAAPPSLPPDARSTLLASPSASASAASSSSASVVASVASVAAPKLAVSADASAAPSASARRDAGVVRTSAAAAVAAAANTPAPMAPASASAPPSAASAEPPPMPPAPPSTGDNPY